jgi:hypothetical protein
LSTRSPRNIPTCRHGKRLVDAALSYQGAVIKFSDRLLDHASATRDFSMLTPEQYKSAAQRSPAAELAVPLARTVFDPPSTVISPEQVISIVEKYRPAPPRRRPPRPPDISSRRDPIEEARRRKADERDPLASPTHVHAADQQRPAAR